MSSHNLCDCYRVCVILECTVAFTREWIAKVTFSNVYDEASNDVKLIE